MYTREKGIGWGQKAPGPELSLETKGDDLNKEALARVHPLACAAGNVSPTLLVVGSVPIGVKWTGHHSAAHQLPVVWVNPLLGVFWVTGEIANFYFLPLFSFHFPFLQSLWLQTQHTFKSKLEC